MTRTLQTFWTTTRPLQAWAARSSSRAHSTCSTPRTLRRFGLEAYLLLPHTHTHTPPLIDALLSHRPDAQDAQHLEQCAFCRAAISGAHKRPVAGWHCHCANHSSRPSVFGASGWLCPSTCCCGGWHSGMLNVLPTDTIIHNYPRTHSLCVCRICTRCLRCCRVHPSNRNRLHQRKLPMCLSLPPQTLSLHSHSPPQPSPQPPLQCQSPRPCPVALRPPHAQPLRSPRPPLARQ